MTELGNEDIKVHKKRVSTMSKTELDLFVQNLFMSDIDEDSRKSICSACEVRQLELEDAVSPLAVCSDFDGDIG